jgi:solute carrier family 25 protein 39/40
MISVPSTTVYMITYDSLLTTLSHTTFLPEFAPMISGVLSRTLISSTFSPFELLKTNLQATPLPNRSPNNFRTVLGHFRGLVKQQGLQVLWRGLGATLWRDVPFSGIYWTCYDALKRQLGLHLNHTSGIAFISGVVSGSIAAVLTSPFDVLKTRRQALLVFDPAMDGPKRAISPGLLKTIFRTEGWRALFVGLSPRIAKISPACGIMIACFEVPSIRCWRNFSHAD